jgi:hypothetical protein
VKLDLSLSALHLFLHFGSLHMFLFSHLGVAFDSSLSACVCFWISEFVVSSCP